MSEWKEHDGIALPVSGNRLVEVQTRDGFPWGPDVAARFCWTNAGGGSDILRYRLLDTPSSEEVGDGGPAFAGGDPVHGGHPGMSQRAYIATAAMQGMLAGDTGWASDHPSSRERLAGFAVAHADALLAALAARKEK